MTSIEKERPESLFDEKSFANGKPGSAAVSAASFLAPTATGRRDAGAPRNTFRKFVGFGASATIYS